VCVRKNIASLSDEELKAAAMVQWTADPCGSSVAEGVIGTRAYFESLLRGRSAYAPWMAEELDYAGACGKRVLDVGCGQGIDLYRFAAAGARATGIDLTPRHVELARAHLAAMSTDADVLQGDAEALPFADASFDLVSSNGVLHHTPNMGAALGEIRRVLNPGGAATIIVYNRNSLYYWLSQVVYRGIVKGGLLWEPSMANLLSNGVEYSRIGARPLVRTYTAREMRRVLRRVGLVAVETTVRHFRARDTPITRLLARWLSVLNDPETLDRIGRVGGWYIVARGIAPERR